MHQARHELVADEVFDLLELAQVAFGLHQIQQDLHLLGKSHTWLLLQQRQQEVHGVLRQCQTHELVHDFCNVDDLAFLLRLEEVLKDHLQ